MPYLVLDIFGALIIRIAFRAILCYKYNKDHPKNQIV